MSSYEFDQRTADRRIPTSTRCRTKRRPLLTKARKISNAAKTAAQRRAHHWLPPILSPSLVGWAGDLPSPLWAGQAKKHPTHCVETLPTSSSEWELQLCQSSAQELLIWLRTDRDKFPLFFFNKKPLKKSWFSKYQISPLSMSFPFFSSLLVSLHPNIRLPAENFKKNFENLQFFQPTKGEKCNFGEKNLVENF